MKCMNMQRPGDFYLSVFVLNHSCTLHLCPASVSIRTCLENHSRHLHALGHVWKMTDGSYRHRRENGMMQRS